MKKITIVVLIVVLLSDRTYAQQPRLGVEGGLTLSAYKANLNNSSVHSDLKPGITLGLVVDLPLAKNFFLRPGINWIQKGSSDKETIGGTTTKSTITTNEYEIPLSLLYKSKGFFVGAGASLSCAMEGHSKVTDIGGTTKEDVNFGNGLVDDRRGVDFGANLLAGYELPCGLYLSLNFNQGLRNLVPKKIIDDNNKNDIDIRIKSHYFGFRIGYLIKEKK